jgi:alpha-beta hydrolase superfamily lysophospholipase
MRVRGVRLVLAALLVLSGLVAAPALAAAQTQASPYGVVRDPAFEALPGAIAESGYYAGGAYRIEIPNDWNGALVVYAHGYRGEGPDIFVSDSPIREHLIANGYAWAASSYRGNSYRPDWGVDDTFALRDLFIQHHGSPRWTILHGQSMGGHVLVASLEQHPDVYQAALSECGVLTGIGEFDYLASYTAAADFISGAGLLNAPDTNTFASLVASKLLPELGKPGAYTAKGAQFDSVVKYLTGGDLPFREAGLAQFYIRDLIPLGDPANAPTSAPALRALRTTNISFQVDPGLGITTEQLNANVKRFESAPGSRSAAENAVFADFTGQFTVPLLSIHDTGDAFVPFAFEQEYRRKTQAAGTGDLLVQRAIRRAGHCNFSDAERNQAFDDLVLWLEQGVHPQGEDVLTSDQAHLGLSWTTPREPDDPLA